MYEDIDSFLVDPKTENNLAYGHVGDGVRLTELVIYAEPDDIKPDPQTQGNVAYGHVQLNLVRQ